MSTKAQTELSTRMAAYNLLRRFEKHGDYRLKADDLLDETLKTEGKRWPDQDRRFLTMLVYGTLRYWFRAELLIRLQSGRKLKDIDPHVRTLLRMGLFQLEQLDQVPDYAAIDTTVALARQSGGARKTAGFINAVLRGCQKQLSENSLPIPDKLQQPMEWLSWTYALPPWFSTLLIRLYGAEQAEVTARIIRTPAPPSLRVNTLKTGVDAFCERLKQESIGFLQPEEAVPEALILQQFVGSPARLPGFAEGEFTVQDVSSALVSRVLAPETSEAVLDLCAAPGSKTAHIAALMNNTGSITAVEAVEKRTRRLADNLKRLGVTNTTVTVSKAEDYRGDQPFDRVLADVPCSGLGTVRKHPEILIQARPDDLLTYPPQQQAILDRALDLLKPGSILVYSTCTILPDENRAVVDAILARHPDAQLIDDRHLPIREEGDGFYVARITR